MEVNKDSRKKPIMWIVAAAIAVFIAAIVMIFTQFASAKEINSDEAVKIALEDAGIARADVNFVNAGNEYDEGRKVYDVKFFEGNMEYDYEIDAKTGKILEKDTDIEDFVIPETEDVDADGSDDTISGATQAEPIVNPVQNQAEIGEEKAKSIALSHAAVDSKKVLYINVKQDIENGKAVYDVEFATDDMEYDYEIDAASGSVIKVDMDKELI